MHNLFRLSTAACQAADSGAVKSAIAASTTLLDRVLDGLVGRDGWRYIESIDSRVIAKSSGCYLMDGHGDFIFLRWPEDSQ